MCPDFYLILSGLDLGDTTTHSWPKMAFKLKKYFYFYFFLNSEDSYFLCVISIVLQFTNVTHKKPIVEVAKCKCKVLVIAESQNMI